MLLKLLVWSSCLVMVLSLMDAVLTIRYMRRRAALKYDDVSAQSKLELCHREEQQFHHLYSGGVITAIVFCLMATCE